MSFDSLTFDTAFSQTFDFHADDERVTTEPTPEELVRHVLAAHLECEPDVLRADQHLDFDLGITRLGLVLISLDLEDVTHVAMPFDALERVHTVGDLSRVLAAALRELPSRPW